VSARGDNATAMRALERRVSSLASMPVAVASIAPAVAAEIRGIIAANIAAQRAPDGSPWPPTEDGRPALAHAMRAVDVRAVGASVVITVSGVESRHDMGAVKGGARRQIVPYGRTPDPMREAIERVAQRVIAQHLEGRGR
jgi:hypothetical protein